MKKLTLLFLVLASTTMACDKLAPNGVNDTDGGNIDADALMDTVVDQNDVSDADGADATDGTDAAEVSDMAEMDMGPLLDCVAECSAQAEFIQECFSDIVGFGAFKGRQHPGGVALLIESDDPIALKDVQARAQALAPGARVVVDNVDNVITVEGSSVQVVRDALLGQDGVHELDFRVTPVGRRIVLLPRIIVSLKTPAVDIETVATSQGALSHYPLNFGDNLHVLVLEASAPVAATAENLAAQPDVLWAEPDVLRQYEKRNDPLLGEQWHLDSRAHAVARPSAGIMATEAWTISEGSADVIIGVFDDGVDWEHPDLAADIVPGVNLPAVLGDDIAGGCCSHGTAVAGIAAATGRNNRGVRGVCPGCKIMPIFDSLSTLSDLRIASRLTAAVDQGAAVINNSWGPLDGDPRIVDAPGGANPLGQVVLGAIDHAENNGRGGMGTVLVWAAGNGNELVATDPYATHPLTMAVAAYDDQTRKSWYSDFGPEIDVAAPSSGGYTEGTVTTIPENVTYGMFVTGDLGERYTYGFGGTSSAAPTVAGLAGLIISVNPNLTAAEVRDVIRQSTDKIDPMHAAYDMDGHSIYYGYGGINAYRALIMAQGMACDTGRTEACNGVDDNCDGTVDEGCTPIGLCEPCLRHGQCASGICSATPGDSVQHCLDACDMNGMCGAGFTCQGTVCVPDSGRCAPCEASETCNGVDDDCNGQIDDGACSPSEAGSCIVDAQCGSTGDGICASGRCQSLCQSADDCGGDECVDATDRYGQTGRKVCAPGPAALCIDLVCNGRGDDIDRLYFFECMEDAEGDCGSAIACAIPFL